MADIESVRERTDALELDYPEVLHHAGNHSNTCPVALGQQ